MLDISAALVALGSLLFVHDETVDAYSQVSSQPALRGIVFGEQTSIDQFDKESLGQVLSIIYGAIPAEPYVLIDCLPICLAQTVHGAGALGRISAMGSANHGPRRGRKAVAILV